MFNTPVKIISLVLKCFSGMVEKIKISRENTPLVKRTDKITAAFFLKVGKATITKRKILTIRNYFITLWKCFSGMMEKMLEKIPRENT